MNVPLRPATSADASAVAGVFLASRKQFLPFAPLAHPDDSVRRWIAEILIPTGHVTVAVDSAGTIIGMMALAQDGSSGWIEHLYLHPSAVNQGIGTRLLELAKSTLGSPIRLYAFQANTKARRFYERHGFTPLLFSDGRTNQEKCPDVLYEFRTSSNQS